MKGMTFVLAGLVVLVLLSGVSMAGNEVIFFEDFEDSQHIADNWKFNPDEGSVEVIGGSLYLSNPGPETHWRINAVLQKEFLFEDGLAFAWDIMIITPGEWVPVVSSTRTFAFYTEPVLFEDYLSLGYYTNTEAFGWGVLGTPMEVPGFVPANWYRIEVELYHTGQRASLTDIATGEELFSKDRMDVGMVPIEPTDIKGFFIYMTGPGEAMIDNIEVRKLSGN